jgi:hypothetical protein
VVDTTSPTITSVTSSTADAAYTVGASINVTVNFSEPVTLVGGNLQVALDTGAVVSIAPFGPASSASGTYVVAAGQNSPDLNALSPLALSAGTLRDAANNNCALAIPPAEHREPESDRHRHDRPDDLERHVLDRQRQLRRRRVDQCHGQLLRGRHARGRESPGDPRYGAVVSIAPFGPAASASGTTVVAAGQNSPASTPPAP